MNKWIICLILSFSYLSCNINKSPINSSGINWVSLEESQSIALESNKDIFIFVYAPWCTNSDKYLETTFKDSLTIKELNEYFVPVRLNAQETEKIIWNGKEYENPNYDYNLAFDSENSYHDVLYVLGAQSIPSVIFYNKNLDPLGTELGYIPSGDMRSFFRLYSENL